MNGEGEKFKDKISIFKEKNPKINRFLLNIIGKKLYVELLERALYDLYLSDDEIMDLNTVINDFSLKPNFIKSVKSKYAEVAINKLSEIKLQDNILEDKEKDEIYQLAEYLEFPKTRVDEINKNNAIKIYNKYKDQALSDKRLSPDEEKELEQLRKNLQLSEDDIPTGENDKKELAYYKLLWEIENGYLPETQPPILLQKSEICHYVTDADRIETKIERTGYVSGSRGVSIRIAKGITYRVGSTRGYPIKEEVTYKYPGMLCLTNKRIIFHADKKGFVIPLKSLISLDTYSDGIKLFKSTTNYLLQYGENESDLVPLLVTSVLKNE